MSGKFTEEEIMEMVKKNEARTATVTNTGNVTTSDVIDKTATIRNLLVIGCGDGGSMIASEISTQIKDCFTICYNTSTRAMDRVHSNVNIIPDAEDGSGKIRDYSKDVFKSGSYKILLGHVQSALEKRPDLAYVLVCTTADGGTGSGVSPMIGKFVSDNVNIPVIMVGVYPSLSEDATAQYNAMTWQDEVIRTGLPYMIFDNEIGGNGNKIRVHGIINSAIANVMKVISGDVFGDTNISMIDSMDMWMLLQNTGKRIVIALSDKKPTTGQTLDDYVLHMIKECHQPVPVNTKGIGIFVKGPKDMISSLDTSMSGVREVYGDAVVQYSHIEESDKVSIAIIMSGNSEPEERLYMMKSRYDDITNSQKEDVSSVASILGTMSNPIGGIKRNKKETIEPDLSALDF